MTPSMLLLKPKNHYQVYLYYTMKKLKLTCAKGNSNQDEWIADIAADPIYDTSNRKRVKLTDEIIDRIKFYLWEIRPKEQIKRQNNKRKEDIHEDLKEE